MMITHAAAGEHTSESIYESWLDRRSRCPDLSTRECAAELGVSEARLVAVRCAHGEGYALAGAPGPLLAGIATLGTVTAVTASSAAVLANVGAYGAPDIGDHTGIVIGENIDLRIFPSGWKYAYALAEQQPAGMRRSIAIFDANGMSSHAIVLGPHSDVTAYDALVTALALPAIDEPLVSAATPSAGDATATDDAIDVQAYVRAFAAMQDTHDFFMLLHRFALTREQGLRLAGPEYARPVARDAHRGLFTRAADDAIPLMIFVANSGMVQIAGGVIPHPTISGTSCGLIDPHFNFKLDELGIARAWAVRKPTVNGIVTSLELYAADGSLVAQIFGERHAGETERTDWAGAVSALPAAA